MILTPLVLAGCSSGSAKVGTVEGKVTVDGTPANSGSVVFTAANGQTISGQIQTDGTYKAVGVPTGAVKVAVTPPPTLPGGTTAPPIAGTETKTAAEPVPIPAKYGDPNTSGLSTTVKRSTTYNVELTAK